MTSSPITHQIFIPTFAIYGAEYHLTDEEVEQSARDHVRHILKS